MKETKQTKKKKRIIGICTNVADRYEKIKRIGEGTYGIVYKARDKQKPNEYLALKRCIPHGEATEGFPITTIREIHALRMCVQHPSIVTLDRVAVSRNGVFLVLEFCDHDMATLLDDYYHQRHQSPFSLAHVKRLSIQLLEAVSFLHERQILHRDLKVPNLLYHRGTIKVADFGLSRTMTTDRLMTQTVASLWYRPLELLLGSYQYGFELDMWAVGCVIGEIAQAFPLMNGKTELDQIEKIFDCVGVPDSNTVKDCELIQNGTVILPTDRRKQTLVDDFERFGFEGIQLLLSLLHLDPKKRVTAAAALESDFFTTKPLPTPKDDMPLFRR